MEGTLQYQNSRKCVFNTRLKRNKLLNCEQAKNFKFQTKSRNKKCDIFNRQYTTVAVIKVS